MYVASRISFKMGTTEALVAKERKTSNSNPFYSYISPTRFVPESFRWYVSHNRVDDAERVINFIGKVNGYDEVDMKVLHAVTDAEKERQKQIEGSKKYTILDIIKDRKLLKITLLLAFIW